MSRANGNLAIVDPTETTHNAPSRGVVEYTTHVTGYKLYIEPVPLRLWARIQAKAFELYPDPEPPMKKISDGDAEFAVPDMTEYPDKSDPDYQKALGKAQGDRAQYHKTLLYGRYLSFADYSSEDIVEMLTDEIAFAKEMGAVWNGANNEDYFIALFYEVLHVVDENNIQDIMLSKLPVSQEEIVDQLRVFRVDVQRSTGGRYSRKQVASRTE